MVLLHCSTIHHMDKKWRLYLVATLVLVSGILPFYSIYVMSLLLEKRHTFILITYQCYYLIPLILLTPGVFYVYHRLRVKISSLKISEVLLVILYQFIYVIVLIISIAHIVIFLKLVK
jgi:hypothetical protein